MRVFEPAFAAHIAGEVTTLARCWRVVRRDGVAFGFTDHDRDLVFDATTFRAGTGVSASAIETELGFAAGGGEIAGALADSAIAEDDVLKGVWDGAAVEMFMVNWAAPEERALLHRGSIGEIRRVDRGFVAEMRGLAAAFDETRGRLFQIACDAALGDTRCGVVLTSPDYRANAAITTLEGEASLVASGLTAYAPGWFRGGTLRWTGGANAGLASEIADHRAHAAGTRLDLWRRPVCGMVVGDTFEITAGCDRLAATCRDKFANLARFRGFPHIPDEAILARIARTGEPSMDGGSLFR